MRDSERKYRRKGSGYSCKGSYMSCREVLEVKRIDCLMDSKKPHTIKYRDYYLLVLFNTYISVYLPNHSSGRY